MPKLSFLVCVQEEFPFENSTCFPFFCVKENVQLWQRSGTDDWIQPRIHWVYSAPRITGAQKNRTYQFWSPCSSAYLARTRTNEACLSSSAPPSLAKLIGMVNQSLRRRS